MANTFHIRELDDESRAYLRQVGESQGQGMDGAFVSDSDYGFWGCLASIGVGIILAVFVYTSESFEDPVNVTCLQMAGLLLGGWLVIGLFRRIIRGMTGATPGAFFFADSVQLWCVRDQWITVIPVASMAAVSANAVYNEKGQYQHSKLILNGSGHQGIKVKSAQGAQELADYLLAAKTSHGGKAGAQAGSIPTPQQAHRPPSGLLAGLVIAGLGVIGFIVLLDYNRASLDDEIYKLTNHTSGPELRAYLLNPHHRRHRAEAEQALVNLYAPVLARIRAEAKEPELGAAFADLIASVQTQIHPYVALRVVVEPADKDAPALVDHMELALGTALTDVIGKELIAFLRAPEGTPAQVELTVGNGSEKVGVTIRPHVDAQPVVKSLIVPHNADGPPKPPLAGAGGMSTLPTPTQARAAPVVRAIALALTGKESPEDQN